MASSSFLKQILTGNILLSGLDELAVIIPLYAAVGALHWLLRDRMTGAGALAWDFIFYATFGVVVTIAKLRTHSSAGECQFSHKPASAMMPRLASAST